MLSSSKYIAIGPLPGSNLPPVGVRTATTFTIDPGQMIVTTKSGTMVPPRAMLNLTAATPGGGTPPHIEPYQLAGTTKSYTGAISPAWWPGR